MTVVVDASVIGAIMFGEPEADTLRAHLHEAALVAPSLIDYELSNLTVRKIRRRPDTLVAALAMLDAALRLPITRVAVPGLEACALATRTGLTASDASYLWTAMSRDLELVTLDAALARASAARERE
jgi:predicted nucleic acid-binding protein